MRDGEYVSTDAIADTSVDQIVSRMVGREVADLYPKTPAEIGDVVLEVEGLSSLGTFHDVSFAVRAGEIVGLAGLVGAGRSEIARAVFGVDKYDAGSVRLAGQAGPAAPAAGRDPRRHRVRPRGPPQAGPGHRRVGRPQRRRGDPPRPHPRRPAHQPRREPRRRAVGRDGSR